MKQNIAANDPKYLDAVQPGATVPLYGIAKVLASFDLRWRDLRDGRNWYKLTDREFRLARMAKFAEKWLLLWSEPDLLR